MSHQLTTVNKATATLLLVEKEANGATIGHTKNVI